MLRSNFTGLVVVLAIAFSSVAFSQDAMMKQEVKKDEAKKEAMGELKVGSCSPECGFMVRSHNEGEVMEMLKMHSKKQHNMEMTDKDAKARMKAAGHMEMKKEVIKEEKKEMK